MTILLSALAAVLLLAWGLLWSHARDQGRLPGGALGSKAKEVGIVVFGLPIAGIALVKYGLTTDGLVSAGTIWATMAGAWSLGHLGGMGLRHYPSRTGLSVPAAYGAMALTGALVTLGPAGVMAWHGAWMLAVIALLAGAAKVLTYEIGYLVRGLRTDPPHATWIGAVAHGAVAQSVTGACMVLS